LLSKRHIRVKSCRFLSLICGYSAVEAEITVSSHHIIVAYRHAISVSTRRTEIAALLSAFLCA
jgi:hypothetical protein